VDPARPVANPAVGSPNERAIPRVATSVASPELAVLPEVSTATGRRGSRTGFGRADRDSPSNQNCPSWTSHAVRVPSRLTNAPAGPSPSSGASTVSIGNIEPPVFSRRSTIHPQTGGTAPSAANPASR
jgi:hypothetical protein